MAKYKLTRLSGSDLESILAYTLKTWGGKQRERYVDGLQACLQELADRPGLGGNCDAIRPGLMRMEQGHHVVFYRKKDYGIRVIRILHQSKLPDLHLLNEKEQGVGLYSVAFSYGEIRSAPATLIVEFAPASVEPLLAILDDASLGLWVRKEALKWLRRLKTDFEYDFAKPDARAFRTWWDSVKEKPDLEARFQVLR